MGFIKTELEQRYLNTLFLSILYSETYNLINKYLHLTGLLPEWIGDTSWESFLKYYSSIITSNLKN